MTLDRRPIVGVMGSGSVPWAERSIPVGRLLARLGVHLLTGGGGGVMEAVSRAFAESPERAGRVIGVLPCAEHDPTSPKPGYPNRWVELPIRTHLPLSGADGTGTRSRNPINVLTSDAIVVLPGSAGTASEVELALAYGRPAIAWLEAAEQPELPAGLPRAADLAAVERFLRRVLPSLD